MYFFSQSPFEALEKALGSRFSPGADQHELLSVLNREHAKASRWKINLQKIQGQSGNALSTHAERWNRGNEAIIKGIELAYMAVNHEDEEALARARQTIKSGHDLLRQGGGASPL